MIRKQQPVFYWAILSAVAVFCCGLAILQYRWTGELARAERERLRQGMRSALSLLSRDFNVAIADAAFELAPTPEEIAVRGREEAYAARYALWKQSNRGVELFRQIAIAVPHSGGLVLNALDPATGNVAVNTWPPEWARLQQALLTRMRGGPPPPPARDPFLFEIPRFGAGPREAEQEWLILELNPQYLRSSLLPELLRRHLHAVGVVDFQAEVFTRADPSVIIYRSHEESQESVGSIPEASVALFEPYPAGPRRGGPFESAIAPDEGGRGRWQMVVRSRGGSLDALVQRTRWRNMAISGGILALLLASVILLFRASQRAQQLADLQMNFVAGVSHELRTPLTVIRTAAFNLREKVSENPEKVKRYGTLVEQEAQKLDVLIQQVLQFANTRSGRVIGPRAPVRVETVIEEGIEGSQPLLNAKGCTVEKNVPSRLPLVMADAMALRQVVQNLLENAAKYGTDGRGWIGVSASSTLNGKGPVVQIRVSDRGRGIPPEEQKHIFDAFFRGERAVQDQIHGTGLGLNLVKQIVEAHGGSVDVKSEPEKGTEFIVQIPAL